MRLRNLIVAGLVALTCTACGPTEKKPPTPGEVKAFASVCDKANDSKRIAVEGYLRLPEEEPKDRPSTETLSNARIQRQTHRRIYGNREPAKSDSNDTEGIHRQRSQGEHSKRAGGWFRGEGESVRRCLLPNGRAGLSMCAQQPTCRVS